MVDRISI
ncbi:uncharacterized protein FFNC_15655 [Fusarium fujikuroi]|nr:uncharacterized protein FFC1_12649 [Fusarium fujikuroi]SCO54774.1 uncharacterized protein FFNC_15655 [Fusarium fujikuroi]SCV59323.1 uncharacterized protein FFFS_13892 [Fusarium fujikuroi]SCV61462.1 uncharacterized protein FFFS_16032 [Fusarium fujikuroi]